MSSFASQLILRSKWPTMGAGWSGWKITLKVGFRRKGGGEVDYIKEIILFYHIIVKQYLIWWGVLASVTEYKGRRQKKWYFWSLGPLGAVRGPTTTFGQKGTSFFLCFHSIQNLSKRENTHKKNYLGVPPPKKLVLLTTTGGGGEGSPLCGGHHPKVQVFFWRRP